MDTAVRSTTEAGERGPMNSPGNSLTSIPVPIMTIGTFTVTLNYRIARGSDADFQSCVECIPA